MTSKEKFIALAANMIISKSDAIIILQGDKHNRIAHACDLYKNEYSNNIVFSGDALNFDYGSYPLSYLEEAFKENNFLVENIIHENKSKNTKEQAQNIIQLCLKNNWESIILVISNFHQYRAYLTFLQELINQKLDTIIKIYNSPCNLSWFEKSAWGVRHELLEVEFEKIKFYQEKGDVCSYDKAIQYIEWIEQH